MTFQEAYHRFGPDTMAIAEALGITEAEAEKQLHSYREQKWADEAKREALRQYKAEWQRKYRASLAELRAERPA